MHLENDHRDLLAFLLITVEAFTPTFLPKVDEHGLISVKVTEGQYAAARAAQRAARKALGYAAPQPSDKVLARYAERQTV